SSARRSLYDPRAAAGGVRSDEDPLQLELRRVLVVEDDRVTLTLLNHRLVRDGHEVMSFENGREAHAWAEDNDFDLAVLDVKVPGMDGFELLSRI
ncbi:MAG: response regulator, partial [Actinobacteria bacterium]|nr:response regulator [Actinomycetota bacterium]NIU69722.1 response regulator [Actinomycetota bacterium]NIW31595.1 response regulator [Actinomycetota bacterium]NIX23921.1 response regulator [Actinomycetota bacterium]